MLILGGELLVGGSVRIADRLGVSPLVIGLTLVGFGTSAPELVTSIEAALAGSPGIAYGNIVGSNIANILLIVGVTALLAPIAVRAGVLARDGSVMLAAAAAFAVVAAAHLTTRAAGLAFIAALGLYVYAAFRSERTVTASANGEALAPETATDAPDRVGLPPRALLVPLGSALCGLVLVLAGASGFVDGAVALARFLNASEVAIGLTVVALGTSVPELVTSVVAAMRRQTDIAFGNIIGSNIYNVLGIGGVTALIAPSAVPYDIIRFDNPVMIVVSVVMLLVAYTGSCVTRREGALLLSGYGMYLWWIIS